MDEVRETGRRRKKNKNEMEKGMQKQQIEGRSVVNEQMQKGDMEREGNEHIKGRAMK